MQVFRVVVVGQAQLSYGVQKDDRLFLALVCCFVVCFFSSYLSSYAIWWMIFRSCTGAHTQLSAAQKMWNVLHCALSRRTVYPSVGNAMMFGEMLS